MTPPLASRTLGEQSVRASARAASEYALRMLMRGQPVIDSAKSGLTPTPLRWPADRDMIVDRASLQRLDAWPHGFDHR